MSKEYTWDQINAANLAGSILLVFKDKVYDVTKFIMEHPGGPDHLKGAVGSDANEKFKDIGHSSSAKELRESFCVGVLIK